MTGFDSRPLNLEAIECIADSEVAKLGGCVAVSGSIRCSGSITFDSCVLSAIGLLQIGHTRKALQGCHHMKAIAVVDTPVCVAGVVPRKSMLKRGLSWTVGFHFNPI